MTEPQALRIDFVSDVSCPWCAVGLASLERALDALQGEVRAEIHFQPFELNPQMAREGEDVGEHISKKYGMSRAQLAQNQENIRQRGAAVGFTFAKQDTRRIYNTFDAHRLLHWAEDSGQQHALKRALLTAYFTDGEDVSDHAVLARVAEAVGLDGNEARAILAGDRYAAEVRAQEQFFQRAGIHSVPAIIINRQHLISGGQPPEVFEQALRQIAAAG
ncbi:DsbA family oxidoreductase [Dyella sp. KULCS107]|uniref:DsbA family oxidoreductase n=1 Tax=Dyella sp. KULCS107 TaxID=3422216 RepID=UPI003D6F25D4